MTDEGKKRSPGRDRSQDPPPCLIRVDKEGRMWHLDAEMTHEGINNLLRAHVRLDEDRRYIISMDGQECLVEVEDTFFVIIRIKARPAGDGRPTALIAVLNDGTEEELDPSTLTQNEDHVLYAQVKGGLFPARFLRRSYYQLAEYVEEKDGRYILPVGGREYRLA